MKSKCYIFLLAILIIGCKQINNEEVTTTSTKVKDESLTIGIKQTITSNVLGEERPIIISLPKGYEDSKSNYPVLYLTDGLQNIWHTIGSMEVLTRTGSVPPMIIVGIESTNRSRDFSPTFNENSAGSGGGSKFLGFIEEELMPYVDSNYRTHPFRVLEGHSLGGLFTASVLMDKPELFDGYIIMSPSFWWNNEEITVKAKTFFKSHPDLDKAVFFGIGTYESGTKRGMRKELQNFIDAMQENKPENLRFEHKEMDREGHMSSTLLSNYYGLKSIFSDLIMPDEIYDNYSDTAFLKHENDIMVKYGKDAKQSAEEYMGLAFHLMNKNNLSGTITVFKRGVEAYNYDINLLSFLASTYEKNNEIDKAISTYKKAIDVSIKYNFAKEKGFKDHIYRLEKK